MGKIALGKIAQGKIALGKIALTVYESFAKKDMQHEKVSREGRGRCAPAPLGARGPVQRWVTPVA